MISFHALDHVFQVFPILETKEGNQEMELMNWLYCKLQRENEGVKGNLK